MWEGTAPLGYDVKDRKLVMNEADVATVRMIFQRYAELGSVALLKAELDRLEISLTVLSDRAASAVVGASKIARNITERRRAQEEQLFADRSTGR